MTIQRTSLVALAFTLGCEPAELVMPGYSGIDFGEEGPLDSDGDGITDDDELELGTDPQSSDTDFDGWSDPEELARNTDPADGADVPYTGGWPIGDCRDSVQADASLSVGGIAPDFELVDMYGDTVRLQTPSGETELTILSVRYGA